MKRLEKIYLAYNKITNVPKGLSQIRHLDTLNLDENPISSF
jgi:Leucine-rich repeat (LRR) protein